MVSSSGHCRWERIVGAAGWGQALGGTIVWGRRMERVDRVGWRRPSGASGAG